MRARGMSIMGIFTIPILGVGKSIPNMSFTMWLLMFGSIKAFVKNNPSFSEK